MNENPESVVTVVLTVLVSLAVLGIVAHLVLDYLESRK